MCTNFSVCTFIISVKVYHFYCLFSCYNSLMGSGKIIVNSVQYPFPYILLKVFIFILSRLTVIAILTGKIVMGEY